MDDFHTGAIFWVWVLAFTVPALVVLLVLCVGCRDPELDMPQIDDYAYKCPPRNPPRPAALFSKAEEDNESIPSYENEEQPCATDNDKNYIEVLPDAPFMEQGDRDGVSTGSIGDQYENMPESAASSRHSLGEYVNVLEPDAAILDICIAGGNSDPESEDDIPDYENIICPRLKS
ncbi:uncharacterized protein LOC129338675 isoform X4 [Eublepharis macularius]|uniref:Uncharacterized protein LOC129338675 isoform X4 n=1 Tax=Eublepharis macularius TaxID=481883 RepID=A0AA97K5R1_EUBMA|nr:uncharacterized protein LOC129338675 isoform X4 [Eublepharis macularius]